MGKFALLVGINYNNTEDQLEGCMNDVYNTKSFLESYLGYTNANIDVLTDDTPVKPTRNNILNAIKSLVEKLKPGDEAWFHYSGHAILVKDRNRDEKSGYDTCICPLDYNNRRTGGVISDDTIRSNLVMKIPSGVKLYVMLDACHSGTGCDLYYKYDDSSFLINKKIKPVTYNSSEWSFRQTSHEFPNYKITNGDVFCLSSSQDNQESADTYIESDQMYGGFFTSTLLSLLKSNDLSTYKWKNLLKDICCIQRVSEYEQRTTLTSGKYLNTENAVFSTPVRNFSKPSNFKSTSNKKYIQMKSNIMNIMNTRNKINKNKMKKMIFM